MSIDSPAPPPKAPPPLRTTRNVPKNKTSALWSGAAAGLCVDLTLYPLDTIKTRLQSQQGFKAAGGFTRIYAGVPAIAIGSAPSAALFFLAYESVKLSFERSTIFGADQRRNPVFAHMAAACLGELAACLIRVPTEVFKQRAQAAPGISTFRLCVHSLANEGLSGFYRGYWSTVSRELPFSFIEFPLWEYLKRTWSDRRIEQGLQGPISPLQSAVCGSFAGAVAAGVTTPLDLAKTRIMLTNRITARERGERPPMTVYGVLKDVYRVRGVRGLFAGFVPRVTWMALGGFVFFGAYDKAVRFFNGILAPAQAPMEHLHIQGVRYYYQEMWSKILDYLLFDEETLKKKASRTFEDSLREAEEGEEIRRAFIEAAKKKFEGTAAGRAGGNSA